MHTFLRLRVLSAVVATAALTLGGLPATADPVLPNDPLFGDQWSLAQASDADIDAPEAWGLLAEVGVQREIVFAVVDGGYDLDHEDLRDRLWTNPGEIAGNGIDDEGNGYVDDVHGYDFVDDEGNPEQPSQAVHGSHVAGVVGATDNNGVGIAGIAAPAGVKLMLLRSNLSVAGEAWEYALANGAHVVNNSWGPETQGINIINYVTWDQQLKEISQRMSDAGMVQTFAAGYTVGPWPDVWDDYTFPGVLRVTQSDRQDRVGSGSHANPLSVDIVAPSGVPSTGIDDEYGTFGGTSAAAPHTAGVAALIMAAFPGLTNAQVADAIMTGVDVPAPDYATASRSGGRLNAHKAMLAAQALGAA